jgi:autotransporter-associated beta strand protein
VAFAVIGVTSMAKNGRVVAYYNWEGFRRMFSTSRAAIPARVGDGSPASAGMTATISAVMEGSGGIDKTDLGTLVLSVTNTYTGGATFTGGVLSIDRDANLGAGTGALTFNGGTLRTTSRVTSARTVTLAAGGGTIDTAVRRISSAAPSADQGRSPSWTPEHSPSP